MKGNNAYSTQEVLAKLKQCRKQRNFSQEDLARKLFLSKSTYCKIEKGLIQLSFPRLKDILSILNISLDEFLSLSNANNPSQDFIIDRYDTEDANYVPLNVRSLSNYSTSPEIHQTVQTDQLATINDRLGRMEKTLSKLMNLLMAQTYTVRETQSILGNISYNTVIKLIRLGKLEQVPKEKGSRILITAQSIQDYLKGLDIRRER